MSVLTCIAIRLSARITHWVSARTPDDTGAVQLTHETHRTDETLARSIAKTASYRVFVLILDFTSICLFTSRLSVAVGFTVASNVYTTLAYLAHERIWDRIRWGRRVFAHDVPPVTRAA